MARDLRIEYPGAFHHVMSRGYARMSIFRDDEDFERFLADIAEVYISHGLVIHAYCLMGNHFHLFTETPNANLQQAMHRLLTRYSTYFKFKYQHEGKVYGKRYKSVLVDSDEYAATLSAYIHLNPVGVIVGEPLDWRYSSYREYLLEPRSSFLDTHLTLALLDKDEDQARSKLQAMTESNLDREALCELIEGKSILGSPEFIDRIRGYLPEEINTELSGLLSLKLEEKVPAIKSYLAQINVSPIKKKNLLIYCLREKTYLSSEQIVLEIEQEISPSALSNRVRRLKYDAQEDLELQKIIQDIDAKFHKRSLVI